MATRTYLFTPAEQAQFGRLKELGFERTDYLEGTEEAYVVWRHEAEGVKFTFFTEPYVCEGEDATKLYWNLEIKGNTNQGKPCVVFDQLLAVDQFALLTSPQHWWSALATLRTEIRGSVALHAFLETLVKITQNLASNPVDPSPPSLLVE